MSIFKKNKKMRKWPFILLFIVILFGGISYLGFQYIKKEGILENTFVQKQLKDLAGDEHADVVDALPTLLGFEEQKTYLLLFLNNTELRPGGGFIGSYATVRVDKGVPEILIMEGTEGIDGRADKDWRVEPPVILTKELYVDKWYFRDSNWSPDFQISTKRSLDFYKKENGVAAEEIDGVIAVTTEVLEHVLEKTGDIEVQGMTFTKDNVIEMLEREVEYDFAKKGIDFKERKQIMRPFFEAILKKVGYEMVFGGSEYIELFKKMIEEKHILVYAVDLDISTLVKTHDWGGEMVKNDDDYFLWVDANLAALKTDHVLERSLDYQIKLSEDAYIAEVDMTYTHDGIFDWRTTRYRSYARVYVPEGSLLKETKMIDPAGNTQIIDPNMVDSGIENGRQWFGVFIVIEPGTEEHLIFTYQVAPSVVKQMSSGIYNLYAQKQLGTKAHSLTIAHEFGTTIEAATPAEEKENWGNTQYTIDTDLRVDRTFSVQLKKRK
ncbi:MAG: DUF4012 domain-containing protein [Candidatus Magasanikbacteria bacterium]|nr:DUF4012 domain-containing protein [Candidatus Magasanikbacteria bacterium]